MTVALAVGLLQCLGCPVDALLDSLRAAQPTAVTVEERASGLTVQSVWTGDTCHATITNQRREPVRVREVILCDVPLAMPAETALYGEGFQMLSQTAGTLEQPIDVGEYTDRSHYRLPEPEGHRVVYGALMLSPPHADRNLLGFTSCRRFVGKFCVAPDRLRVVVDTECLALAPGATWQLEDLCVVAGPDRDTLFGMLADRIERNHPRRPFPRVPTGWCSWYCFGPQVTARDVANHARFITQHLPQLRYVQIDDGYQQHMGDWLDAGASFGGKVQPVLRTIRECGLEPAIWLAPFIADQNSQLVREHPEWLVHDAAGAPLRADRVTFGGWRLAPWYVLDGTHPAVQAHLEQLFRTLREQWGCTYFKLDANFWGAIHGGRFHDAAATRVEAYRRGMTAIRRGAGDAFLLGCNHPLWPSLGLIDGSRSSLDIDRSWASFRSTGRQNLLRNWQNGKLWWNDADCVLLTGPLSEAEFRFHATVIFATGGMVLSGDDLTTLAPERLATLRRLLPPTGHSAHFHDDRLEQGSMPHEGHEIIVLLNWHDLPQPRSIALNEKSRIRDYWTGADLGLHEHRFELGPLPPHDARVIEVIPSRE